MLRHLPILLAFLLVLGLPFALRPKNDDLLRPAEETLVIVSPHNEAIRHEFAVAFTRHIRETTGKTVRVDWRVPGGTTEISRYLASQYLGAFRYYWTHDLHRAWTPEVRASFDNPAIKPEADAARRDFLESSVSSGIDLFYGGGGFDFSTQAAAGRLVESGFIAAHPEIFNDRVIPQQLGGEEYWDARGRWIGTCLSAFGICYSRPALARLGIPGEPAQWSDLADPRYLGQLALCDPMLSGSAGKAYEMLIQQQMQRAATPEQGWAEAMRLLQRVSGNARYFSDSSQKIALDVGLGDAAAGMTIDFFARFQSETEHPADGRPRLGYVTPLGGSSYGPDPIGLLRGAPHRALALQFIEFVMSPQGQRLWNRRLGTPDGPGRYALRRLPIRRDLYTPEEDAFRSDPGIDPYLAATHFTYHGEWTGSLFRTLSFIQRVMCIDSDLELKAAWAALIRAKFPPQATATFSDVSAVDFTAAKTRIKPALSSANRIEQVRLAKELGDTFRANYHRAQQLAEEGK